MAQLKGKPEHLDIIPSRIFIVSHSYVDKVQEETISLVAIAYSSIFEDGLCTMLNQTPEALNDLCQSLGWEIQSGAYPRLIIPKKKTVEKVDSATAEDQLQKLTDFVSFLEN